jgi:hypothetical protein
MVEPGAGTLTVLLDIENAPAGRENDPLLRLCAV